MRSSSGKASAEYCPAHWSNSLSKPTVPPCHRLASSLSVLLQYSRSSARPQLPPPMRVPRLTAAVHSRDASAVVGSGVKRWETQIGSLGESQRCLGEGAPAEDPWLPVAHCYVLARSSNQHKRWWSTRAEPSCRQGDGHQQRTHPDGQQERHWETLGFLWPRAVLRFTRELVNTRVPMPTQLPSGCAAQCQAVVRTPLQEGAWEQLRSGLKRTVWAESRQKCVCVCLPERLLMRTVATLQVSAAALVCQETATWRLCHLFSRKSRDKTCWE